MKHRFTCGIVGLLALAACLLTPVPCLLAQEVDQAEILRWGERAVVSGEGPRDDADVLYSMAMAPPADDSDQWYVTVWGTSKDPQSGGLVQCFERDPHLAAFTAAPPGEGKRPWAHFNFYHADNPQQAWRFKQFAIPLTGPFPIVTIHPPRDGSFGGIVGKGAEARMVVIDRIETSQIGNPEQLAKRIQASVGLWCKKLKASGFVPPAKLTQRFYGDEEASDRRLVHSDSHGQDEEEAVGFPWGPAEPPPATQFNPQFPAGGPAANPTVVPSIGLFDFLLSPKAMQIYLLVIFALGLWEKIGPRFGFPGTLAAELKKVLEELKSGPPNNPPASPS